MRWEVRHLWQSLFWDGPLTNWPLKLLGQYWKEVEAYVPKLGFHLRVDTALIHLSPYLVLR